MKPLKKDLLKNISPIWLILGILWYDQILTHIVLWGKIKWSEMGENIQDITM